jgi:hypothetical protein
MFLECNKNDRIETQGLHTKDRWFNILAPEVQTASINNEEKNYLANVKYGGIPPESCARSN